MQESNQQIDLQRLTNLIANFFAAKIVLSQLSRAAAAEEETATKTFASAHAFLSQNGFIPDEAFLKPLPEGKDQYLVRIIGQDGCMPYSDKERCFTVPGSTIQFVLSNFYPTWFHNLKRV